MASRVIVTCDRCGKEWEVKGFIEAIGFDKGYYNFCDECKLAYEDFVKEADERRQKMFADWLKKSIAFCADASKRKEG